MKKLALAALFAFATTSAVAAHCPKEMKLIDDAMAKNPKLTPAQMTDVKKHRAEGEAMHKAGKHAESVVELAKAQKILGVTPSVPAK